MNYEQIARICHEANKTYCDTIGDASQEHWEEAEEWQRDSAIKGVQFAVNHPDAPPSYQHDAWMKDKQADGWTFGRTKDAAKKEHPCMVSYDQLPVEQRLKDHLFRAIVKAFVDADSLERSAG